MAPGYSTTWIYQSQLGSDLYNFGIVQFWTDTISAQRHDFAMKLLNVVPALIVVIVVVVLSFRRGTIFVA